MQSLNYFCIYILAASALFSLYRQFQMLQQNSYYPSRYFKWLKGSFAPQMALMAIFFCAISWLQAGSAAVIQAVLVSAVLGLRIISAVSAYKKSIKKLVFTPRVRRQFACTIIIIAALISVYQIFTEALPGEICRMLCVMLCCVTPLLALLVWTAMQPAEKAVSRYYIRDAEKILKEHKGLIVIGITGSYGKTTTKFILNRILSERFNTVCTPQSFNTTMGVVRTVRESIKPQTQVFICEMGAKKRGDIKQICDIVHPKYGIITSVGEQHLDTFKSVGNVFRTKFELADAVTANGGICLANTESSGIAERADTRTDVTAFGKGTKYRAENISYSENGSRFDLMLDRSVIPVTTRLLGAHSVSDILAAAAMAHILGVSDDDIRFAVSAVPPTEHRLQLKSYINGSLLIDDAYNANPEGCIEAVRILGGFKGRRKVIITPGLIELGEREYDCNFALGLEAAKYCDIIILVGKNRSAPMREAVLTTDFDHDSLYVAASFAEAVSIYTPFADKNTVLLIENDLPDNYLN